MKNGVIASLLVIAILAGAGAGYLVGSQTSTETTTQTALQSSVSNSSWEFVGSTNATTVKGGQFILLWANLTNTSPSNQTIRPYVQPFINPNVVAANGTVVWAWDPPEVTWLNTNVTSGQSISQDVVILTTGFQAGAYQIEVAPLSSQFSNDFNLTLRLSVG
jgi:hypothetical protein